MADTQHPIRTERFTMLEPRGPNNPPLGSDTWPVVEPVINERFTMLEPKEGVATMPPAVQNLLAQLAVVIESLDQNTRAMTLSYIPTEFTKRLAG